jgi:hypothetical protein
MSLNRIGCLLHPDSTALSVIQPVGVFLLKEPPVIDGSDLGKPLKSLWTV